MILKATLSVEYNQIEVFQINSYYTEDCYIEAGENEEDRKIILSQGNYLEETDSWEEISILTDQGFELYNIKNKGSV